MLPLDVPLTKPLRYIKVSNAWGTEGMSAKLGDKICHKPVSYSFLMIQSEACRSLDSSVV